MLKKEDRLKSLLSGRGRWLGIQEVSIPKWISPVAKIKIVWVGWGWQNTVNRMIESWLEWVEFIAVNTDVQALYSSLAEQKINIWKEITKWLWAWSNPEVGKESAEESREEIKAMLEWANMVFITCWLWGWTGTWAAPVIAEIAKELWCLTIWVVTKPFSFEWANRMAKCLAWYENLKEKVDALITIPNDRILSIIDKKATLLSAFSIVDDILNQWVQWVSDLITQTWLINLDFADVTSVMNNAWTALMGIGYGSWENRAVEAAREAMNSPLLESSMLWARWVLVNIVWWTDLTMFEIDEAAKIITDVAHEDATIKVWAAINSDYDWEIKITVIATWFDENAAKTFQERKVSDMSKSTPFSKKVVDIPSSPAIFRNATTKQPMESRVNTTNIPTSTKSTPPADDLDIPSFLRKKM